jgi:hypothetical protein
MVAASASRTREAKEVDLREAVERSRHVEAVALRGGGGVGRDPSQFVRFGDYDAEEQKL